MRVALDSARLIHAIQVRGLHLSDVARLSGLALPTVSAAVSGRLVNIATALAVARAISSSPMVAELKALIGEPPGLSPVEPSRREAGRPSGSERSD